jgi:hypothetical protein
MDELKEKYGSFFETGLRLWKVAGQNPSALRKSEVPKSLWPLIPYAEFWGLSDDGCRIDMIYESPNHVWADYRESIAPHLSELEQWLAGPAARSEKFTIEYIAFSYMLDAFDYPRKVQSSTNES